MSKGNRIDVTRRSDGTWQGKKPDASRASVVADTQREAQARSREILGNQGGGELVTHGTDNKIRAKDTVAPGNDPYPPKG